MLLLGPEGGNLELGSSVIFRGKDGSIVDIPYDEILSVKIVDGYRIEISFTDLRHDILRVKTLCQSAIDVEMLQKVFHQIKGSLDALVDRPKKILAFINPGCGTYRGLSIYEEEVDPIFGLCGVSTEVVVTQSFGEGRRLLLTRDLTGIDGIVVVGGDGTFGDIAQGLLERAQRDAGLDIRKRHEERNDENSHNGKVLKPFSNIPSTKFVSNAIPIGHIPGGSGNGYATTLTGVHDPTSTAILIALGKIAYTDVTAVAQLDNCPIMDPGIDVNEILNKTTSTFLDFGVFMGCVTSFDVKKIFEFDSEMRKKYGPLRYFIYPFILKGQGEVVLNVRHANRLQQHERQLRICRSDCTFCVHSNNVTAILPIATQWEDATVRERQIVSVILGPTRHKFTPTIGMFPHFHMGDGLLHLLSNSSIPAIQQMLHWKGWLIDDFHAIDSTPFHIPTDEMVVENVSNLDIPVYALMEESNHIITGRLHYKVLRKTLKTYGCGLRNLTAEPQRASMSVLSFFLRKSFKVAAVFGLVGLLGFGTYKIIIKDGQWKKFGVVAR